jgi:hypothetical protein
MPFDFPVPATVGQAMVAPNGATFVWDGAKWTTPANAAAVLGGFATSVVNVLDHGAKGDGTTNDYSAIQSVLNTTGGKATIFIPDTGQPYMTNGLVIQPGTDLLIHGTLKLIGGSSIGLLNIQNAANISIRGHGILDANGAAQTPGAGAAGIGSYNASNVRIDGVTVQNSADWNLNITNSTNVRVDRVTLLNCRAANEFAAGCNNCWISNSLISGVSFDGGMGFYGGVTNSGITDCTVTGAYATGIFVYSDAVSGSTNVPCSNLVIANNIVHHNNTGGISADTDGTAVVHTGIAITGNRCYTNNNAGNHQYADIWIGRGAGVTISGNDLSGSGSGANPTWGVFVGSNSSHVNITGNTIWNEGQGGTAGSGVYIQAANDVLVEANHIYDTQTTHTMSSAITGNAGARNAIVGNLFGTLGGAPVTLVLAADTVLDNAGPGASKVMVLPANAANDAAAATAGVPVGGEYRNGSVKMVRVA